MKLYEIMLAFIYILILPIACFIFAIIVLCIFMYQTFKEITRKKMESDKINDANRRNESFVPMMAKREKNKEEIML